MPLTGNIRKTSGINVIDEDWGGLDQGRFYLVHGRSATVCTQIALRFVRAGMAADESLLYISSGPLQDVMKQVNAAGINLRAAYDAGRANLLRFALPDTLLQQGDKGLATALRDLAAMIEQHRPERVVINDFAPFVAFASPEHLRETFKAMQATIAPLRATVLLVLSESEMPNAPGTVEVLQELVTGAIQVAQPDVGAGDYKLTLTPQGTSSDHAATRQNGEVDPDPAAPITFSPSFPEGKNIAPDEPAPHTDRRAFGLRLQQHFHRQQVNDTPFTLIAVRSDTAAARKLNFADFYSAAAALLLETEYDWLVNLHAGRLIVLIPNSQPDDAHRLFARLKQRLMRAFPVYGSDYLHAFSALVVNNGGDFQNAEDFLDVAMEERVAG
ncbi:MAG TPA: ATPase domain-containing protein [Rhodothermales bacterium]|nr:ATPase domain-containing protein [Rhodothermales bacterium]